MDKPSLINRRRPGHFRRYCLQRDNGSQVFTNNSRFPLLPVSVSRLQFERRYVRVFPWFFLLHALAILPSPIMMRPEFESLSNHFSGSALLRSDQACHRRFERCLVYHQL